MWGASSTRSFIFLKASETLSFLKKCILNKYFWSKCKKHINHYRAQLYPEHYDNILICHCFQCEKNHTKNPTYAKHTKSVMCAYALIHRFKVTASTWQFNGRGGKWSRSGCRAARVVKAGCSRGCRREYRHRVSVSRAAKLMLLISRNPEHEETGGWRWHWCSCGCNCGFSKADIGFLVNEFLLIYCLFDFKLLANSCSRRNQFFPNAVKLFIILKN